MGWFDPTRIWFFSLLRYSLRIRARLHLRGPPRDADEGAPDRRTCRGRRRGRPRDGNGRPILYVPGIQDMNDIQTIASLTIPPGSRKRLPNMMPGRGADHPFARHDGGARDGAGSLSRGWTSRSVSPDQVYYVTDEQFEYVAYVQGLVVRERPAACFYLGSFFAESLILAEMGNRC